MHGAVYGIAMFVDRIKVFAKAGNGGRGCVSFRREKFVPRGGPDGGDGGKGGDVILRADEHADNLASLFYEPLIKAKKGGHGRGKQMYGRGAPAKIVKVPVGTVVWEELEMGDQQSETSSQQSAIAPLADLALPNEEFVLCRGGKGGKGNVHFKSSRNRAPLRYRKGRKVRKGISSSNCEPLPTPAWWATRTRENPRFCGGFLRRTRRWRRIHLRLCTQ
jgi:GTP-binding protein